MISGKTDCGLQYAVKKSRSAIARCSLTIRCGTRDEGSYHSGIAHFTEHTLFKGTAKKSSKVISSCLDRLGGDLNAFTTKEEIVLHATVLKEDMAKAVSLLLELATCPTFPDREVDIERGVVLDEIISYLDSPDEDIYDKFEEMYFKGHPLGKSILGTKESVGSITSGELKSFVEERFTPGNMALAVVADIDEKHVENCILKLAGKYFGQTWKESRPRETVPVAQPGIFNIRMDKQNHEANVVTGWKAPSLYDIDKRYATILLSSLIGGPFSNSMLNVLLREKNGWVYNAESVYSQYSETGLFTISMGCDRANLEKCLGGVRRIISSVQDRCLTERKLKAAKKQMLGWMAISSDNDEASCINMGKELIAFGKIRPDENWVKERISSISAETLRDVACEIFRPEMCSTLIYI